MECPDCGCRMKIERTYLEIEGDDSPSLETKVYSVQELCCRNPKCIRYGRMVQQVRHRIDRQEEVRG